MVNVVKGERAVFIPDIHAPFQDNGAVSVALEFVKWFNPHHLIFLGDNVDFYAISRFIRDPERRFGRALQREIDTALAIMGDFVDASPRAKRYWIQGNHEERLEKYLYTGAPELAGLRALGFAELFPITKRDITYVPDGSFTLHGLTIKHGNIVRLHSAYTAKAEFERNGVSGVSGHSHRLGKYYKRHRGGYFCWVEGGCLCKTKNIEYMRGAVPDWQQGLVVGYFKTSSGRFTINDHPIVSGKMMFGENQVCAEKIKRY